MKSSGWRGGMKKGKGFYSISVVAKMFSVHQQTIRMYEKEGLIVPKRSDGNTRLFSEEDVERLEEIINLTHKMGVNLAGVDIILKMQKKLAKMQGDMNKLFKQMDGDIAVQKEALKAGIKQQVTRLVELKQDKQLPIEIEDIEFEDEVSPTPQVKKTRRSANKKTKRDEVIKPGDWDVEYDNE